MRAAALLALERIAEQGNTGAIAPASVRLEDADRSARRAAVLALFLIGMFGYFGMIFLVQWRKIRVELLHAHISMVASD